MDVAVPWVCYVTPLDKAVFGLVKFLVNKPSLDRVVRKILKRRFRGCLYTDGNNNISMYKNRDPEVFIRFIGCRSDLFKKFLFLQHAPGSDIYQIPVPFSVQMTSQRVQQYIRHYLSNWIYLLVNKPKKRILFIADEGIVSISRFGLDPRFRTGGLDQGDHIRQYVVPYMPRKVVNEGSGDSPNKPEGEEIAHLCVALAASFPTSAGDSALVTSEI